MKQFMAINPVAEAVEKAEAAAAAPEPVKPEPAKTEPVKAEPVKVEPAKDPKPEPAKPEPKEEEEEKRPHTAKEWEGFIAARKAKTSKLAAERDEWQKKYEESTKKPAEVKVEPPPDYEQIKKERDLYDEQLRVVNIERHPKFVEYYKQQRNLQVDMAKQIVGPDKAAQIELLLGLPEGDYKDSQMDEFLSELSSFKAGRLSAVTNNLTAIETERQTEIKKAHENFDKIQAEQASGLQQRQKQMESLVEESIKGLTEGERSLPIFQTKQGDDEWNKCVTERLALAKQISLYGVKDPKDYVQIIAQGVTFPALLSQLDTTQKEVEQLKSQLKDLTAANPKPPKEEGAASNGESEDIPEGLGPMAIAAWTQRQAARHQGH
jgi:hypothetical protein